MRLSGVLPDDDDGSTDLATLEKRLADRAAAASTTPRLSFDGRRDSIAPHSRPSTTNATPVLPALPSPRSGTTTPEPGEPEEQDREEDALAEMMCSLVTNNCGETRYIGSLVHVPNDLFADCVKVLRPAFLSSRPKVFSGSMTKRATILSGI